MAKSDNEAREQRILDAAVDLFVHYGYDKTTVSDIAREAGVSKGAIYLHYDSKDALLEALIIREMQIYAETWFDLLEADPQGGTIAGMYKNSLYALNDSKFISAMFKQDGRILGSYLRKPDNIFRGQEFKSTKYEFVQMMQAAGAVRPELDPKVTAHIMNMLGYGLVAMDEVMDKADIPPYDDLIEGIADFMHRALTPDDGGNIEAGKAIIQQLMEAGREQLKLAKAKKAKEGQ